MPTLMRRDYGELVPIPLADINRGLNNATGATMLELLGRPGELTDDCSPVTNERIRRLLVESDVGPFRVTGLGPAVEALARIFARVRRREPALYSVIGTAGMLCCRRVRLPEGMPALSLFSNHSWGTAIDLTIDGRLDPRGDGKTQLGLLQLHEFFAAERFYWAAGLIGPGEDAMHFEASEELVRDWAAKRVLQ